MKRAFFLTFVMIFLSCEITLADVVTLWDGSVFEGIYIKDTDDGKVFSVDEGTVFFYFPDLLGVENRTPTENERARFISFRTGRYDVTDASEDLSSFEGQVVDEFYALAEQNPDMSDHPLDRLVGEKFNIPPIIVEMIVEKEDFFWWMYGDW